jgi:hypothetical protein
MWTPDIVRARFIEAADTERRMPGGGVSGKSGYWPQYVHSFEDMNGWGTRRLAEEREMQLRRTPPSAGAISRYLEALKWTAEFIGEENRRRIIWAWARCQTSDRSFAEYCRREGLVKMTAYRRLGGVFQTISQKLINNSVLLRMPDEKWVLPNPINSGSSSHTLATHDEDAPAPHQTFQIFDGDRPGHTLTSPQSVELFEKFLEKTNRRRRKEQERRRKLGLLEESVA